MFIGQRIVFSKALFSSELSISTLLLWSTLLRMRGLSRSSSQLGLLLGSTLQHKLDDVVQVHRIMAWQLGIGSFDDLVVEAFQVLRSEWRFQSRELVNNTAARPDVRLRVRKACPAKPLDWRSMVSRSGCRAVPS
jgi:hypothetical protein